MDADARESELVGQLLRLINCAGSVMSRLPEYPPCSDSATAREWLRTEIKRAERVAKGMPACAADEGEKK